MDGKIHTSWKFSEKRKEKRGRGGGSQGWGRRKGGEGEELCGWEIMRQSRLPLVTLIQSTPFK